MIEKFLKAVAECEYFTKLPLKNIPNLPMMENPVIIGTMKNGEKSLFIIEEYTWTSFQDKGEDLFAEKFVPHEHLDSWAVEEH